MAFPDLWIPGRGGFSADDNLHRKNLRAVESWARNLGKELGSYARLNQANAWSAPQTFPSPLTVQDVALTRLAMGALGIPFVGARVYRSTTQSLTSGASTAVIFDNEPIDSHGFWVSGAATRLTIPTGLGGRYLVTGGVGFAANATGDRSVGITKNGGDMVVDRRRAANGVTFTTLSAIVAAAADDNFELFAFQDSGGALNTVAGEAYTWLACHLLGT